MNKEREVILQKIFDKHNKEIDEEIFETRLRVTSYIRECNMEPSAYWADLNTDMEALHKLKIIKETLFSYPESLEIWNGTHNNGEYVLTDDYLELILNRETRFTTNDLFTTINHMCPYFNAHSLEDMISIYEAMAIRELG